MCVCVCVNSCVFIQSFLKLSIATERLNLLPSASYHLLHVDTILHLMLAWSLPCTNIHPQPLTHAHTRARTHTHSHNDKYMHTCTNTHKRNQ